METAARDIQHLRGNRDQSSSILFNHSKSLGRSDSSTSRVRNFNCYRCGGNHFTLQCQFIEAACRACKKKGHLAQVCCSKPEKGSGLKEDKPSITQKRGWKGSKSPAQSSHSNYALEDVNPPRVEDDCVYMMFPLSECSSHPFTVEVQLWSTYDYAN